MTSFNQTQGQTKLIQRRLGLMGLTASAALAVTALSAIANPQANPQALTNSPDTTGTAAQQSAPPTPVAPTAQAPKPTVPTSPTVPAAPGVTAPTNPSVVPVPATPSTRPMTQPTAPGSSAAPTTPARPEAQTPASPTAPQTSAATGTIADVAAASDTFKTLVSALNEAELTQVLKGQGPFTVFAPTDAAFNALPPGTVTELMKPENRATLVQVLKYHVVSGAYPSSQLEAGALPSAEGSPINVTVTDGKVKVNDANVLQPDITATNGVIHAIDRVILPPRR